MTEQVKLRYHITILMNRQLNIVFTIDEKFVQHFSVTLISLLENNRDINLNIYVIHDIANLTSLNQVAELARQNYSNVINLIAIDSSLFARFKTNLHYSKAVYFRLLFTEILPHDIDKILFLDADIVFDGLQLLAVSDHGFEGHIKRLNKMGFPIKKYFNAGALLINLKGWRQIGAAQDLISLADQYMDKLSWWDQDILNMYFYDRWELMDSKYNTVGEKLSDNNPPVIIHYSGPFKPWLYLHTPNYKNLYWKYIKLTPFKNATFPDANLKNMIIKNYYILQKAYFPNFDLLKIFTKRLKIIKEQKITLNNQG